MAVAQPSKPWPYYNFHFRETDKNDSKNVLNEPDKDSNEPKKDPNGAKEGSYRTKKTEVIGLCKGSRTKWIDDIRIYQRMRDELFGGGLFQTALPFLYRSHLLDDATMVLVIHNCRLPAK